MRQYFNLHQVKTSHSPEREGEGKEIDQIDERKKPKQPPSCTCCMHSRSLHYFYPILVGCFGFNGPLGQYFSLYRAVSQRGGERIEMG